MKLTLVQEEATRIVVAGRAVMSTVEIDLVRVAQHAIDRYTIYQDTGEVPLDSELDQAMLDAMFEATCFVHEIYEEDESKILSALVKAMAYLPTGKLRWRFHPIDIMRGSASPDRRTFLQLAQGIGANLTDKHRCTGYERKV
jgi:hypothetical protein